MTSAIDIETLAPPAYADLVLPFWRAVREEGRRCAVLTIVGTTGSSPRPIGSQLAVSDDGRAVGLLSGGCIETALMRDAMQAIEHGISYVERYGASSPFIDLRLPCGSGIDIHFDTALPDPIGHGILDALAARSPVNLLIGLDDDVRQLIRGPAPDPECISPRQFVRSYLPACKLVLAGSGQILLSLAQLCRSSEIEVEPVTTDRHTAAALAAAGIACELLPSWKSRDWSGLDRWSALTLLSHDHEDEADILIPTLASEAFYIGALGSRKTHANRCKALRAHAVLDASIARIKGPVGLPISAASPPEIAASILAELIAEWRLGPARRQ